MKNNINNEVIKAANNIFGINEAINFANTFADELERNGIIPNKSNINTLLDRNPIFNASLKTIVTYYYNQIIDGNIDTIFYNNTLLLIIEIYCNLNGIVINNENDFYNENSYKETGSLDAYLNDIAQYPILSYEKQIDLTKKIANGDKKAKELFIKSNLRLVIPIANKYTSCGIPKLDLIQQGNIGLMVAAERYNYKKDTKFSTYATYWIRQSIVRYIENNKLMIRIPSYLYLELNKYYKAIDILQAKLQKYPSINEIANQMDCTPEKVLEYQKCLFHFVSLDEQKYDEDALIDMLPDTISDDVIQNTIAAKQIRDNINLLLTTSNLSEREIQILKKRFGFYNNVIYTLDEVGKEYNLTRERVRQIEVKALQKIKSYNNYKKLVSSDCLNVDLSLGIKETLSPTKHK